MKKGFTLVELLAVIAILAILVIIALPNVMGMFNTAKENSFNTEVKEVFKTAQQTWISDNMFNSGEKIYARCKNGCTNALDLSGRSELEYYIKLNQSGEVVEYYATDGTFQYSYEGNGLKIEDINGVQKVSGTSKITINNNNVLIDGNQRPSKFYVGGNTYYYIEGMTWAQWLETDYNNGTFTKTNYSQNMHNDKTGTDNFTYISDDEYFVALSRILAYGCNNSTLYSYKLLEKSIGGYVNINEVIKSDNYGLSGGAFC